MNQEYIVRLNGRIVKRFGDSLQADRYAAALEANYPDRTVTVRATTTATH